MAHHLFSTVPHSPHPVAWLPPPPPLVSRHPCGAPPVLHRAPLQRGGGHPHHQAAAGPSLPVRRPVPAFRHVVGLVRVQVCAGGRLGVGGDSTGRRRAGALVGGWRWEARGGKWEDWWGAPQVCWWEVGGGRLGVVEPRASLPSASSHQITLPIADTSPRPPPSGRATLPPPLLLQVRLPRREGLQRAVVPQVRVRLPQGRGYHKRGGHPCSTADGPVAV